MKTVYKKVKKLNPAERGYIAGLIDGEGTITLCRKHINEYRQLAVTIANTEYVLIKEILDIIGAGKITKKNPYKEKHSEAYTYQIYNQQAHSLLTQICFYLRSYKKKRAEFVLENYNRLTPRNGKYSEEVLAEKEKFIKSFFEIKPCHQR